MKIEAALLLASVAQAIPHGQPNVADTPSYWGDWAQSSTTTTSTSTTTTTSSSKSEHTWEAVDVSTTKPLSSSTHTWTSTSFSKKPTNVAVPDGWTLVPSDSQNQCSGPPSHSTSGNGKPGSGSGSTSGNDKLGASEGASWGSGRTGSPNGGNHGGSRGSLHQNFYSEGNARILKPTIDWSIDTHSLEQVKPAQEPTLHFCEDHEPSSDFFSMIAKYTFHGPAITIDHSAYMTASMKDGKLVITFSNKAAYDVAAATWKQGIYLVGVVKGCGKEGELCYFKADSLSFSGLQCQVSGSSKTLEESIKEWEFKWDFNKFNKPKPSATSTTPIATPYTTTTTTYYSSGTPHFTTTVIPATPTPTPDVPGNNTSPGNSTLPGTNSTGCQAPVDTKYGLPTVCLGPNFDESLDEVIGYDDWVENGWYEGLSDFAPALTMDDDIDIMAENPAVIPDLGKRALGSAISWVKSKVRATVEWGKDQARKVPISGVTVPVEGRSKDYKLGIKLPKAGQKFEKHETWHNAIKLWDYKPDSKTLKDLSGKDKEYKIAGKTTTLSRSLTGDMRVKAYCVDCHLVGQIVTVGFAKGSVIDGFLAAGVDVTMDMSAALRLGVEAEFELTLAKQSTKIFEYGIDDVLMVPGTIAIGPYVDLAVEVVPKLTLSGTLIAGAELTWKNAKARLAFGPDTKNEASGWAPEIKPVFNATGEIGAAIEVGFPLGLNIGISIANGKWERKFAIEERPAFEAKASIGGSVKLVEKDGKRQIEGEFGIDECKGIKAGLKFKNEVSALYTDLKGDKKPLWKPKPLEFEKSLWDGCLFNQKSDKDGAANTGSTTTPTAGDGATDAGNPNSDGDSDAPANDPPQNDDPDSDGSQSNDPDTEGSQHDDSQSDDSFIDPTRRMLRRQTDSTGVLPSNFTLTSANVINVSNDTTNVTSYTFNGIFDAENITAYNTTNGYEYTTLIDTDSAYMLVSCADGNIYLQPNADETTLSQVGCGVHWAYEVNETDGAILADGTGRLLHYYPDAMSKTGVSRLRLSNTQNIPANTSYVALVEMQEADGSSSYYPGTPDSDQTFALAVCSYKNAPAKVFIINDLTKGLETLKSPDVKYSITGGEVVDCWNLFATHGSEVADDAWSGYGGDLDWYDEWIDDWEYDWDWDGIGEPDDGADYYVDLTDDV